MIISEDEAEVIRIIYDKFVNTTMGIAAIANFLNNSGYKKQRSEDKINAAVEEIIRKLVNQDKFRNEIKKHIDSSIDIDELDREYAGLKKG